MLHDGGVGFAQVGRGVDGLGKKAVASDEWLVARNTREDSWGLAHFLRLHSLTWGVAHLTMCATWSLPIRL